MRTRPLTIATLLVTALLGIYPTMALAQTRLGFYGGVSVSTLGGSDADDPGSRTAAHGGAFIGIPISNVVALRPGAAFVQKGAEEEVQGVTARLALSYVEFPLLVQFSIPSEVGVAAHAVIGPVFAFEFSCDFEVESQQGSASAECDSPLLQGAFPTTSTDVGLLLGAGVLVAPQNRLSALFQITYELGLSSIDDSSPSFDVKNRSLGIAAGVVLTP